MEAYDPRDFTIHLKDAALYILLRWKLLVSAALAGAILLTVARYVMDISRYRSEDSSSVTLTAEERAHVAAALSYEAAYRRLCAYNEGAPLMHIDPAAAPTRQMRLLVTGENALAAARLYREFVMAQALYRDVAEDGAQAAYMAELVTATVENEMVQAPSRQAFLSVQVVAPTEEICARLSAVVHRLAQEEQTAVAEAVGAHTARWVVDRYAVARDETLAARIRRGDAHAACGQPPCVAVGFSVGRRHWSCGAVGGISFLRSGAVGGGRGKPPQGGGAGRTGQRPPLAGCRRRQRPRVAASGGDGTAAGGDEAVRIRRIGGWLGRPLCRFGRLWHHLVCGRFACH